MAGEINNTIVDKYKNDFERLKYLAAHTITDPDTNYVVQCLLVTLDPNLSKSSEDKDHLASQHEQCLLKLLNHVDVDPKFTQDLESKDVEMYVRRMFQKMEIKNRGDLVQYTNLEEFEEDYGKNFLKPGLKLTAGLQRKLVNFMKEDNIYFGMDIRRVDNTKKAGE